MRWLADDDFRSLVEEKKAETQAEAAGGLSGLVSPSLKLLEQALSGEKISASRATLALNIVKAAASIDKSSEAGGSQLADRLAQLTAKGLDDAQSD